MVAYIPFQLALRDAFYSAGLGIAIAAVYSVLRAVLPQQSAIIFICDIMAFMLGTVLYFSMAITRLYAGIPRWYTIAALIMGYCAWQACVKPSVYALIRGIYHLAVLPFSLCAKYLVMPLFGLVKGQLLRIKQKNLCRYKNSQAKRIKQLQKHLEVLYNSN